MGPITAATDHREDAADSDPRQQRRRGLLRGLLHGLVVVAIVAGLLAALRGGGGGDEEDGVRVVPQFPRAAQVDLAERRAGRDRPNVVFVLTDDQNVDELEHMPRTRRLLVDRGTSFDAAISPHPLCCPARAELLTGQYGQNNGVRHNGGPHGGDQALDPAYPTLPERFAAAGYATGLVGKYLNGYQPEADAPEPGWDLWQPLVRGVYSYDRYTYAGEERSWADDEVPYVTTSIARRTDDAVRELAAGDDPFLLFSWHVAPHYKPKGKVHAPPPSLPRDRRKYRDLPAPSLTKPNYNQAEVSDQPQPIRKRPVMKDAKNERMYRARVRSLLAVDRSVASLVRTLRETGELADTYLVFASDNGHALGEHRLFGKNVLVDEIMDVPVVVRGPGVPAGATSSVPATLVDLPATLLDLAAIDDTTGLDGQSLLAPALGRDVEFRDTTLVQTGGRQLDGWQYRGVQTPGWLYAVNAHTGDGLLYDRRRDPWQLHNRFADPAYAGVVRELEARASRLRVCEGPGCNLRFGDDPAPPAGG
ncbi:hypothetical protein GCM10009737_26550 [Nocardioides lentus]|uniref:Sulfatase N-terminal domain-containing protein n=1 Tax=Nocardioides lentus TaxID=338077 RepID=A0ABN2PJP2_9ACTN